MIVSSFIATILFAVATTNRVSAVVYVDQATYDKYKKTCENASSLSCNQIEYCRGEEGKKCEDLL